jgi:hypothetical protein
MLLASIAQAGGRRRVVAMVLSGVVEHLAEYILRVRRQVTAH